MKNGELKIEKGVPIPYDRKSRAGHIKDVLLKMKKGDSVALPSKSKGVAWQNARNALGVGNFVVRAEPGGGFRVWRIT